jgi:glutamine synthetase adenylyltransferase
MRQESIRRHLAALLAISSFLAAHAADNPPWLVQTRANYTLHYVAADQAQVAEYERFLAKGIAANEAFLEAPIRSSSISTFIRTERRSTQGFKRTSSAELQIAVLVASHRPV